MPSTFDKNRFTGWMAISFFLGMLTLHTINFLHDYFQDVHIPRPIIIFREDGSSQVVESLDLENISPPMGQDEKK